MRSRLLYAATAALLLNVVVPATAQTAEIDRAAAVRLVKQIWSEGTWEQQEAAFYKLSYEEQVAAWNVMTDVRPGKTWTSAPTDDAELRGPCQSQEIDECDHAPAPKPQPSTKPAPKEPSKPPIVTPPVQKCDTQTAYVGYEVFGEPELYAFVYAGQLSWCYMYPSVTGPLSDYTSHSYAANCCMFPWDTDASRYVDKLVPLPAANTQKIVDHHTGYFFAKAKLGPVEVGQTSTPNVHATVLADGSYVCG